jgi:hypothetical protein
MNADNEKLAPLVMDDAGGGGAVRQRPVGRLSRSRHSAHAGRKAEPVGSGAAHQWEAGSCRHLGSGAPLAEIQQFLLPGGINGLGEALPSKYFFNFLADYPAGQEPFQPAAKAMFEKNSQNPGKPSTLCQLPSLPIENLVPIPFKIVQTPRIMMLLYEESTLFRQIFSDGRKLPDDPQPSWLGYSVGKWVGDTFVAETVGLNDKGALDVFGHPRSESTHLTESFHRRDFGHLEIQMTVDDPKTYTKPVSIRVGFRLLPDTELIESFCTEDEKDLAHFAAQ